MNEIYTTVVGRMVANPESRTTRGGVPFTAFRLASTVRRPNPQTREYEDGPTNFFNVTVWGQYGENAASSLGKGDRVVVKGRIDLTWGTTELVKVSRAQVDQTDRLSDEAIQSVHAELESAGGLDAENDEYEVVAQPTGVVPRDGAQRELAAV